MRVPGQTAPRRHHINNILYAIGIVVTSASLRRHSTCAVARGMRSNNAKRGFMPSLSFGSSSRPAPCEQNDSLPGRAHDKAFRPPSGGAVTWRIISAETAKVHESAAKKCAALFTFIVMVAVDLVHIEAIGFPRAGTPAHFPSSPRSSGYQRIAAPSGAAFR